MSLEVFYYLLYYFAVHGKFIVNVFLETTYSYKELHRHRPKRMACHSLPILF